MTSGGLCSVSLGTLTKLQGSQCCGRGREANPFADSDIREKSGEAKEAGGAQRGLLTQAGSSVGDFWSRAMGMEFQRKNWVSVR